MSDERQPLDALAEEFVGRAKVAKVDIGANAQIATDYHIQNVPTVLIFQDGRLMDRVVGMTSQEELSAKLRVLLDL